MHGQGRDPSAEVRARLREQMEAIEARGRAGGAGQPGRMRAPTRRRTPSARSSGWHACASSRVPPCAPASCARASRKAPHARRSSARWHAGWWTDRRYADVLVRSRLAQGRGRRGIEAELAAVGIDAEEAARLVGEAAGASGAGDGQDEIERALELLERRPPHAKNLRQAAYRRLVQKATAPRWPPRRRACGASNRRPGAARGFRRAAPGGGAGCAFRQCWHLSPPHPRAPSAGAPPPHYHPERSESKDLGTPKILRLAPLAQDDNGGSNTIAGCARPHAGKRR